MNLQYLKNVSTLSLYKDKCNRCGMCIKVCPHAVFKMGKESVLIVDRDSCMECGACKMNCAQSALSVNSGVGCATAMIVSAITGKETACCDL